MFCTFISSMETEPTRGVQSAESPGETRRAEFFLHVDAFYEV